MRTMLVTTPIRPRPTEFPPIGSLSIIAYLRRQGINDIEFYHIDANRPRYEDVLAHIRERAPGVIGISAVVSTAYAYTKRLTLDIKAMLPDTLVVVGGNLAASAEILLKRTGTDLCALGEGERVFLNVVRRAESTRRPGDFKDIPGLALLDERGEMVNTGYETALDRAEVYDLDWEDLARSCDLDWYIVPAFDGDKCFRHGFRQDPRTYEPHRRNKRIITIPSAKGCVARCTFCHRWDKGVRYVPVDNLRQRLTALVDKYDVGFIQVGDENFGTDRRWLKEFCALMREFDFLWKVGGMRVNCVDEDTILLMKESGCTYIAYGMETGSERMLEIMEKKTSIADNRNAMKWTIEAGLSTPIQIVLGMPGETPDTVRETIDFCTYGLTLSPDQNPNELSVNYAQALPGTPLYEFARSTGRTGQREDDEEAYLLRISDKDAHDEVTTLNFTEFPRLVCQTWRPLITIEANYAYVRKFGLAHYHARLLEDSNYFIRKQPDSGYFANPKRILESSALSDTIHDASARYELGPDDRQVPGLWHLMRSGLFGLALICHPVFFYRIRRLLPAVILLRNFARNGASYSISLLTEYVMFYATRFWRRSPFPYKYRSLRKIVDQDIGPLVGDTPAMQALRRGR